MKRLKELEAKNNRPRRAVSDLTIERVILKEAASGNLQAPPVAVLVWSLWLANTAYPNSLHAVFWGSIDRHNVRSRYSLMMRQRSLPTLHHLLPNIAAMANATS